MAKKSSCYVDTSAFIAFLDRSDSYHSLFLRCFGSASALVTTPLVLSEGQAWFIRRYNTEKSLQFLNFVEELKPLSIISIGEPEIKLGSEILRKFSDQALTLVDAVGIGIMKKLNIKTCWSTDRHLALEGAKLIIHE